MDVNKAVSIIMEQDTWGPYDFSYLFEDWTRRVLEALGDDETEVLKFIKVASNDVESYLYSIYEELVGKFPSEQMEETMSALMRREDARNREISLKRMYSAPWVELFDGKRRWAYDE